MFVSLTASHYTLHPLQISTHKIALMHQTWRHKSAVKETLNPAITAPAVLRKPRFSPNRL